MKIIGVPLSYVLDWLMSLFNDNFALAVLGFTVIVNLIMLPLSIKSQKSTVKQAKLRPKLEVLKQKYGDDRQKMATAQQELYAKEGVSPAGGCLPLIVRLLFLMGVYEVIRKPLTYIFRYTVTNDALAKFGKEEIKVLDSIVKNADGITKYFNAEQIAEVKSRISSFDFLGINLTETPNFSWDFSNFKPIWWIPILAFAAAMLNSIVMLIINKKANPDQPNMAGMMLTMPIISLIIAFGLPGAVGFYWICSSIVSGIIQAFVSLYYNPNRLMAADRLKTLSKRNEYEKTKKSRG